MPGYIGYTPQFNPISLQEYLTVPTMVLSEYSKVEDVYNETATKAEALKALLGERNADNEAGWRIVDNYEKQLGDLTNTIANGVKGPETYRQAKNASKYYRENMLPLESGIPAYQEEIKKWNTDPTMIGNKPALESYIKNPLYRAQMMSGNDIQQEATKAAAAASARRRTDPKFKTVANGQLWSISNPVGFTPEEVNAWLAWTKDPQSSQNPSPELSAIADQISEKYGNFNTDQVNQYITRGILDGLAYDNKITYQSNKDYEFRKQKELIDYKASKSGDQSGNNDKSVLRRRPANAEQTKEQKALQHKIERYKELRDIISKNPEIYDAQKSQDYIEDSQGHIIGYDSPETRNWKLAEEYKKLEQELLGELYKHGVIEDGDNYVSGTRYVEEPVIYPGIGVGTKQKKVFNYSQELDKYFDNIVNLTSGYNYDVTPKEMQAITQNIWVNSGLGMEKGKTALDGDTDLILDEKGKPVKRSKLKDLDRSNTWVYIGADGRHHFDYNGHTYIVLEEAMDNDLGSYYFGDRDMYDEEGNILQAKRLRSAWDNNQYGYFNRGLHSFANTFVAGTRSRVPAIEGTSSKYDITELP